MEELYLLIGQRLYDARTERGYTLEEAGNRIGVHKSTIQRWENGKTEKISLAAIEILAEYYNVNSAWLSGKDVSKYNKKIHIDNLGNTVIAIPIIGSIKAGHNYLSKENWIGTIDIDEKIANTGDFFALKVHGDSMAPIFLEGDIVILRKQSTCENNQVAVVIVNGNEGTLRKVKNTDDGIILQPLNQAYGPIMYTNKEIAETPVIIAGVFQELRRTDLSL